MAKKKSTRATTGESAATRKKRRRRSHEEMINDLQAEIKKLRAKAAARALKESPAIKSSLTAIRYIDKGLESAAEEGNSHLRHALADARRAIGGFLEEQGVKLPKAKLPKGPRPK